MYSVKPFNSTFKVYKSVLMLLDCGVGYQNVRSPCNVFILDTSSSLGKDGFAQMKEMFSIIIDGMLIVGFQSKEYNHIMSLARIIIHISKQSF